ncbi:MAG TPA: STAS domain-containing protein [Solirubrobacteraceae bacterium]|nr:STAS domain-containing protein [Solirubrobacteraceae bacterium]
MRHPIPIEFDVFGESLDARTRLITVCGEIHVSTAPRLSERLDEAIAGGMTAIVVDLSRVEFIDSTGLSVLLNGLRRVIRRQAAMALVCANPTVLRLFHITRLDATFDILPTRAAALAQVRAQAAGAAGSSDGAP